VPGLNLTRDEATERASHLAIESFEVELDLTTGDTTFGSRTTLRFSSTTPGVPTFVDLIAATVHAIELNGVPLDPAEAYDGARITLPAVAERNELSVVADCLYMNTGEGLHRFVDPVDSEVYLYSQFEVADSRRVFAVFEQPDLKATFRLAVTAPAHWSVYSAATTPDPTPVREGVSLWQFATTPPLSSYVFSVVAGPYAGVEGTYVAEDGRVVPLRVVCRRSLEPHLDGEELLDVTRKGFGYFETLFGRPYPFDKYDQVFVPEFNAGAMENAGCVTFLEDYVFRSKVPEAAVERRAETLLHELAHMWFGDLVTMRWWDDLWLNESFATYASVLSQAEATRWPEAWTTFANVEKTWAYRQDQLPSTHPIVADIHDLEDVEVNFDGITYAKGASVLKQLVTWVGREEFFEGIRRYFAAHAWGNASLADLLKQLEATSGRDLHAWSQEWLETAGVNTLRADFACDAEGRFTSFAVLQEASASHPTLRSHRLGIGLFERGESSGRLDRADWVEVTVSGARTEVPELVGRSRPALVLLNDHDLAYAKIRLDETSLASVVTGIADISDQLSRALCWAAAWDMTRDAEMSARDYLRLVLSGIGAETDSSMVRSLLRQVESAALLFTAPEHREAELAVLADGLERQLRATSAGSDSQLQYVRAFASTARSPEHLALVQRLLEGSEQLDGLSIDTDLRWHLVHCLVARGVLGGEAIDAELARDDTAAGRRYAAAARAARPSPEAKSEAWAAVVDHDDLPNAHQSAMIGAFAQPDQVELLREYREPYFGLLERVWTTRTNETAQNLVTGLYPSLLADEDTLRLSDAWLSDHPDAAPALRRLLAESRDGVARALRAQERDRTTV
jgi:aminopeptidase N